jgi:hypothetical protein
MTKRGLHYSGKGAGEKKEMGNWRKTKIMFPKKQTNCISILSLFVFFSFLPFFFPCFLRIRTIFPFFFSEGKKIEWTDAFTRFFFLRCIFFASAPSQREWVRMDGKNELRFAHSKKKRSAFEEKKERRKKTDELAPHSCQLSCFFFSSKKKRNFYSIIA